MKSASLVVLISVILGSPRLLAAESCRETYPLQVHPGAEVILDGALREPVWQEVPAEESFSFPWREEKPPRTEFRAVLSKNTLYLSFEAIDSDIVLFAGEDERVVEKEDRVEVFFAIDPDLEDYYCIEVDASGRVMEYRASYYRQFDYEWEFESLKAAAHRHSSGYSVEMAIPLRALEELGFPPLKEGVRLRTGLFRAEFQHGQGGEVEEGWMSWCRPDSETPDFHIPSSFGYLEVK